MSEPQPSDPQVAPGPTASEVLLGETAHRPRYTSGLYREYERKQTRPAKELSWRRTFRGCLIGLLVVFLVLVVTLFFFFSRLQRIGAGVVGVTLVTAVTEMDLPDEQEEQLVTRIEGVKQAYLTGDVSHERLVLLLTRLQRSPLILVTRLRRAEQRYLPASNLKLEEQKAGRQSLSRLVRGIEAGAISRRSVERVLHSLSQPDGRGQMRLKEKVSDADLRLALARAREEADVARVPEEPYEPHLADAFERLVDEVLGPVGKPAEKPLENAEKPALSPSADSSRTDKTPEPSDSVSAPAATPVPAPVPADPPATSPAAQAAEAPAAPEAPAPASQ